MRSNIGEVGGEIKMKKTTKDTIRLFAIGLNFTFTIVFLLMFWRMFFNGSAIVSVDANNFNEYWIELILINVIVIFTFFAIILEMRS